jgi:Rad3-related DNA helicase
MKAISAIMSGGDFVIASHTGSGKTLAYLLPIVSISMHTFRPICAAEISINAARGINAAFQLMQPVASMLHSMSNVWTCVDKIRSSVL